MALTVLLLLFVIGAFAWSDPASLEKTADALMAEHSYERARSVYEQALVQGARFDTDLQHARNLGIAYLNSSPPDFANGIKWLRTALTLDPGSDGIRAELAKALLRNGDAEAAIDNFRVLLDHNPQSAEYINGQATAFRQAGNTEAALELYRTSLQRFPNLVAVRIEYARLLNFNRQFVEAKRQFSDVLAIDSGNLVAQVGLAKATSFDGDQESALSMYERILQRHPGLYDAIVGKAFSLLWSGRFSQARPLLEQAARRNPSDREVREALSQLPGFKGDGIRTPNDSAGAANPANSTSATGAHKTANGTKFSTHVTAPATSSPEQLASSGSGTPETISAPAAATQWPSALLVPIGMVVIAATTIAFVLIVLSRRKHAVPLQASSQQPRTPLLLRSPTGDPENPQRNHAVSAAHNFSQPEPKQSRKTSSDPDSTVFSEFDRPYEKGGGQREPAATAHSRGNADSRVIEAQSAQENAIEDHSAREEIIAGISNKPCPAPVPLVPSEPFSHTKIDAFGSTNGQLPASRPGVFALRPEVLLIGGSKNTQELEVRRLSVLNLEIKVECDWSTAAAQLPSSSSDLIVLNAITADGWTSVRMFNWIAANQPHLRSRCIVIVSTGDAAEEITKGPEPVHYLIEPFDSRKWQETVSAALPINALHHTGRP